MKIASILPYKENYSKLNAGAVSLWISDFMEFSSYKKQITVFGYTNSKNYLSNNYININLKLLNSKFYSSTKEYTNKLINYFSNNYFDIIEIHNRPNMVLDFVKKINSKIILYIHNDPKTMKGLRSIEEKLFLLKKVDKIIFISNWVKRQFFSDLNFNDHYKVDVIYHSIKSIKKIKKKKKQIVFVGKLNISKGYDLYCDAVSKVLSKNKNWTAVSIGDERKFQSFHMHKKHKNLGLIENKKVLKIFEESEISVIPSRWEEPFGRTALEASSRGCATIISNRGGLTETTDYALVLDKLNSLNIEKAIIKLIKNHKLRRKLQINGLNNVKHNLKSNSHKIDFMRSSLFPILNFNTNKGKLKIINIYNLGQKLNHRIYNLSLGKKFTNGFIRNGHDVIEISDRDYVRQNKGLYFFNKKKDKFKNYLLQTFKNYNPDLIIFGHSNNIDENILSDIKSINKNTIISQWNEDPLIKSLPESIANIKKLNKFISFVDHSFITTDPSKSNLNIKKNNNLHYFIPPVDKNIECFEVYNLKPNNDIFYAMSHGVNRATLKKGKIDDRVIFLEKLIKKIDDVKYDFYGFANKQPIWGNDFNTALINSKMALNLSRGKPTKYYSSNRIASMMGNGLLTFIDENVGFKDFFSQKEIVFYKNINDLSDKIKFYSKNDAKRKQIAKNGRLKYFKLFNEKKIAKYIIDIVLGRKANLF